MASEARQHHHIPEFYLKGFSTGSGKKRRIQVGNIAVREFFETNPKKIGKKRDFNRVEIEGHRHDILETALSKFETEAAGSICEVSKLEIFEGKNRTNILNLIALLAVRSPQMREHIRQFHEETMKKMVGASLASRERWEAQEAAMAEAGKGPPAGEPAISYDDLREFYENDEYKINLNREYQIGIEIKMHDTVLQMLAIRKWQMYVIEKEESGCFVTTDRPVVLTHNDPEKIPLMYRNSPGFGLPETEVLFPLTKSLALIGSFEGEDQVFEATTPFIASTNFKMIEWAYEQIYTPKRSFLHVGPDARVHHDNNFFNRWQRFSSPLGAKNGAPGRSHA